MSKWDDEFDLDDYNPKKPPAKKQEKGKKNQEDYFDLDEPEQPTNKLPVIANKQNKPNPNPKNNYDFDQIYDDVDEVKSPPKPQQSKQRQKSNAYQDLSDEEEVKPTQNKLQIEPKKPSAKDPPMPLRRQEDLQEEEFYESLDQKPKSPPKSQPQKKKEQEENPYEEEFDEYGEDFQEVEEKPVKEAPLAKKSLTTANLKPKDKAPLKDSDKQKTEEKKLVINTNKVFTNKEEREKPSLPPSIPKPPLKENSSKQPSKKTIEPQKRPLNQHGAVSQQKVLQKSSSKRSLQSNDSRKNMSNSKISIRRRTTENTPSRHLDMVQKQFPQNQEKISQYPSQKLSRLNEQVRQMIRRFNEQLNELINRNMILLKEKQPQRTPNAEERQRVLEEQLKSGATALEVVENELERLRGREGELREEEFQLILQKHIEETKESIKETSKLVARLKAGVTAEGNKLNRQEVERKMAQDLHQIKSMLIQAKKEEEKNDARLEKVEKMVQQLQSKNADKQYELSEQLDNAKDKGISLNIREATRKRHEQLKNKANTLQNHKKVTQSLARTKCQHITHENDQIRNTIRSIDSQIANISQSIEHSQEESLKLIKKARENPKINSNLADSLEKLMKSIEESQNSNYYEIRTQGNKSQASERPLKNSMYQNMGKQKPAMRGNSSKKESSSAARQKSDALPPQPQSADQINLLKPNFMKKKEKLEGSPAEDKEKVNKVDERVWREEEERRRQEEQRKKIQEEQKKKKEREAAQQAAAEEDRKKPFNLKKNRMSVESKEKTAEPSPEIAKISQTVELKISAPQPKDEEKPSIGPKFMRLNRKDKGAQLSKNDISVQKPLGEEIKRQVIEEPLKIEPKQDEEAPAFVPKRLNLRNKIEKKEQGYFPTADRNIDVKKDQKKEEIKIYSKREEPKNQEKNEYAINFSFKEEDPYKAHIEGKKIENEIKLEVSEQKPKFNLRLRDRQKKEAVEDSYIPTRMTQLTDPKPKVETGAYNPFDREPLKKEEPKSYNPISKPVEEKPIRQPAEPIVPNNISISKEPINNPYAQVAKQEPIKNPYAPKEDAPKRERQGPLKKNKLLNKGPKEKFNIYEQAEDLTQPQHVPTLQPHQPAAQPLYQPPAQVNFAKTDELDLNAMLGIKKKQKASDLDDLLGEVTIVKKKENKKNNDFFNDLEL